MKHKDIAIAWLNGKTVQYKSSNKTWRDLESAENCHGCHIFSDLNEYRIKPKVVEMVYYYTFYKKQKLLNAIEEAEYDFWTKGTKELYPVVLRQEVELPQ